MAVQPGPRLPELPGLGKHPIRRRGGTHETNHLVHGPAPFHSPPGNPAPIAGAVLRRGSCQHLLSIKPEWEAFRPFLPDIFQPVEKRVQGRLRVYI